MIIKILILVLLILIIIWLEYPKNNKINEDKPLHIKIFNYIKTPIIVISFLSILYLLQNNKKTNSLYTLKVYKSLPKF